MGPVRETELKTESARCPILNKKWVDLKMILPKSSLVTESSGSSSTFGDSRDHKESCVL